MLDSRLKDYSERQRQIRARDVVFAIYRYNNTYFEIASVEITLMQNKYCKYKP